MSKASKAIRLTPAELEQFKYHINERNAAKEVMEQAQMVMNQAQETWRVASGGLDSFVRFLSQKYKLPQGQFQIDFRTGEIKNPPANQPQQSENGVITDEEREAVEEMLAN